MNQGPASAPNRVSFNRLTGKAIWYQTGGSGGVDLGNIDMHTVDDGIAREKVQLAIDGNVVLGFDEVVSVSPVWQIKGKQFHSPILPLLYMGTANANVVQSSGSAQTFTFTAVLGRTFDIGARNVTLTFVKVATVVKTADVDFYFEANKGLIRIPSTAAGIAAGDTVVVTFDKPALTRESYTAFNLLNQAGTLQLFEMDSFSAVPLSEASLAGSISRDKGSDGDPTKTNQWALRFALNGYGNFTRRAA